MKQLVESAKHTLTQLSTFLEQIHSSEYQQAFPLLSDSTIGMHVRHVVEFYQCLLKGYLDGQINYDARERSLLQESNIAYTQRCIENVQQELDRLHENKSLALYTSQNVDSSYLIIESSLFRELSYVIEHTIHHLAIIKMACIAYLPSIQLDADFGVAYSTIKYRNDVYGHLFAQTPK